MATSVLGPLMAALGTLLRADATLAALAPGGIHDGVPQLVEWPFVVIEVREKPVQGMGTGTLPEVQIWSHAFSRLEGMKEARAINDRIVVLLKDQAITVTGFNHCGGAIFFDASEPVPNTEINGVICRELVGQFRAYFEKVA